MASKTLILLILLLLAATHCHCSATPHSHDGGGEYVLDSLFLNSTVARKSRFLASAIKKIKNGASCGSKKNRQVCNGVSADKGSSLLFCCKTTCRNVLGDRDNCGGCGRRCRLGEQCCSGVCTNVLWSRSNCGSCKRRCKGRTRCEFGFCGYA